MPFGPRDVRTASLIAVAQVTQDSRQAQLQHQIKAHTLRCCHVRQPYFLRFALCRRVNPVSSCSTRLTTSLLTLSLKALFAPVFEPPTTFGWICCDILREGTGLHERLGRGSSCPRTHANACRSSRSFNLHRKKRSDNFHYRALCLCFSAQH